MNVIFIFPPLTENRPDFSKTAKSSLRVRQLPEGMSRGGTLIIENARKTPGGYTKPHSRGPPPGQVSTLETDCRPGIGKTLRNQRKKLEIPVESVINFTLSAPLTKTIWSCSALLCHARSIIMMDSQRKSKPYLVPTPKSLSLPTRATSFAPSASPKLPNLASLAGSVLASKNSQVRTPGAPGKAISCSSSRKACMCSPTNHPGSFRCHLHRKSSTSSSCAHSQLNARRSVMTNSLVKIGSVEGEWVRRALTALIRPSRHHMRRRASFQPRPSRLCHMTRA